MPHKIEISDRTYEKLKELCAMNGYKMGQCADKLLYDGIMIEMYGDVPFTTYNRRPPEIKSIPVPDYSLTVAKEEVEPVEMPQPEGKPAYIEIEPPKPEKVNEPTVAETFEKAGVPTKVVNKITKRRLK